MVVNRHCQGTLGTILTNYIVVQYMEEFDWFWYLRQVCQDFLSQLLTNDLLHILNHYVIGQDRAKRALAVAVYNHYKRIKFSRYA